MGGRKKEMKEGEAVGKQLNDVYLAWNAGNVSRCRELAIGLLGPELGVQLARSLCHNNDRELYLALSQHLQEHGSFEGFDIKKCLPHWGQALGEEDSYSPAAVERVLAFVDSEGARSRRDGAGTRPVTPVQTAMAVGLTHTMVVKILTDLAHQGVLYQHRDGVSFSRSAPRKFPMAKPIKPEDRSGPVETRRDPRMNEQLRARVLQLIRQRWLEYHKMTRRSIVVADLECSPEDADAALEVLAEEKLIWQADAGRGFYFPADEGRRSSTSGLPTDSSPTSEPESEPPAEPLLDDVVETPEPEGSALLEEPTPTDVPAGRVTVRAAVRMTGVEDVIVPGEFTKGDLNGAWPAAVIAAQLKGHGLFGEGGLERAEVLFLTVVSKGMPSPSK